MISNLARRVAARHLSSMLVRSADGKMRLRIAQEEGQQPEEIDLPEKQNYGGKGDFNLPPDHVAAMHSPAGFSCAVCVYVDADNHSCTEPNYIAWNGGDPTLPDFPLEEICSDWFQAGTPAGGEGEQGQQTPQEQEPGSQQQ